MRAYPACLALCSLTVAVSVAARVTRIEVEQSRPAEAGGIAYEILSGMFYGELDPRDVHHRIITDLAAAPRNTRGHVEYSATFQLARPLDPARASGVLLYDVPNRGRGAAAPDAAGHIQVVSGWQGDIPPRPGVQTATVPIAVGRHGRSLTGPAMARLVDVSPEARSVSLVGGLDGGAPRPLPATLDTRRATLTVTQRLGEGAVVVAPDAWAFADCRTTPFPGTPDPTQLCLRDGFIADAAYELVYTGKEPRVLGIGFAATRDLVSYLRSGQPDQAGHANPAGGAVRWTVATGNSQSGNFLRSFVHLGFNADENGQRVFDGINPNIAARQVPLNIRFGLPGGAAGIHEAGSEGTLWWGDYDDRTRGLGRTSLLARCTRDRTCPKIIETFGSAEYWNLRFSPDQVGTDARADIPLPANVRRYYSPGVSHGGAFGSGFHPAGDSPPAGCLLRGNPNPSMDTVRAARRMLIAWVRDGTEPPASRYPSLANGDLVKPEAAALGWPAIPDAPVPDGKLNLFVEQDFGRGFNTRDLSGVQTRLPPAVRRTLPSLVPRVNADGNETAGVPSVYLQVPLGTYTGWNVQVRGFLKGGYCGLWGGFIPFVRTRAERLANGDPRPSLEERYGSHEGFVVAVREVVAHEQAAGWLLPEDAARIVADAERSEVLRAIVQEK